MLRRAAYSPIVVGAKQWLVSIQPNAALRKAIKVVLQCAFSIGTYPCPARSFRRAQLLWVLVYRPLIAESHWGTQMPTLRMLDRDVAKQHPENVFESPLEIVDEVLLTKGEKLATLERWRSSVLGQLDASNEGMPTRGYSNRQLVVLEAIEEAKGRLNFQEQETD